MIYIYYDENGIGWPSTKATLFQSVESVDLRE